MVITQGEKEFDPDCVVYCHNVIQQQQQQQPQEQRLPFDSSLLEDPSPFSAPQLSAAWKKEKTTQPVRL